jgi:hypothetical protein
METMFASSRRSLPPVPRSTPEASSTAPQPLVVAQVARPAVPAGARRPARTAAVEHLADAAVAPDAAQQFVSRLRRAAPQFAAAAGAQTAVVREAVPPARHRRSRCRVVLRYADGDETDLTLLGPADLPGSEAPPPFGESVQRWLTAGQPRDPRWMVPDADAPDGVAVDVTAWLAAG